MMSRQLIILILYIIIITTFVQSKSVLYKSAKEQYKIRQSTGSPHISTNVTQSVSSSQLLSASTLAFLKHTIPKKILTCMTQFNILRCMKIYILQNLETSETNDDVAKNISVTADFFNRIVAADLKDDDVDDNDNTVNDFYYKLTDTELNKRMFAGFKNFFGDREIKIQVTPGFMIKVVSSENDLLDMSLKKELIYRPSTGGILSSRGRKNKYFKYIMKMGMPVMFLPVALLGSFLPMILPGIKMATLFTGAINNAALVAALMYLARTAALENEHKNTVYYTSGATH